MPLPPWYAEGPLISDIRGNVIAEVRDATRDRAAFVNDQIATRIAILPRLERVARQALEILEETVPLGSADVRFELAAALEALK